MDKIIKIVMLRNGRKKIEFNLLHIYRLLKERYGYGYRKINGKGFYLQNSIDGSPRKVNFSELKECFIELLENKFDEFDLPIDQETIIDEFYKQRPIKNGNYARDYLGSDFYLTDLQIQKIV
jgi:hypothetical protein